MAFGLASIEFILASFLSYFLEIARYSLQNAKGNLLNNSSQIIPKDSANERNASLLAGYTASAAYLIKIKLKQLLGYL